MKSLRIEVDLKAEQGKAILTALQEMVRHDFIVGVEVDAEKDHTRAVKIYEAPTKLAKPLFDFGYAMRKVDDYFRISWNENDITYEECLVIYALVMAKKPLLVVETKMGLAVASMHIAQALKVLQKGQLITIENEEPLVRRGYYMLEALKLKEFVNVVSQHADRFLKVWNKPIDMAFVQTAEEYELLKPHLKPDAIVITRGVPLKSDMGLLVVPSPKDLYVYQRAPQRTEESDVPTRLPERIPHGSSSSAHRAKKPANSRRKPVRGRR